MSILEAALRGSAVALLLLSATLLFRDTGRGLAGRISALFSLSAAAYVVSSAPGFTELDVPFRFSILMVSRGAPALFWMWAAAVFNDEFKLSWQHWFAWFSLVVLALWNILGEYSIVGLANNALSLILVCLGVWEALHGRDRDLVDARRRLRLLVAVSTASYITAISVANLLSPGSPVSAPFSIVNAMGLAATAFVFTLSRLAIISRDGSFVFSPLLARRSPSRIEASSGSALIPALADEQEAPLLQALRELMEEHKIYRQDGVSIAVLSGKLGIPEYRLRRLINQQLGHRNFNSFVNGYRLAEAMAALADPSQAEVPILTIALDTGFQSLAPFNRAFKSNTGMTPSEFRRRRLGERNRVPPIDL